MRIKNKLQGGDLRAAGRLDLKVFMKVISGLSTELLPDPINRLLEKKADPAAILRDVRECHRHNELCVEAIKALGQFLKSTEPTTKDAEQVPAELKLRVNSFYERGLINEEERDGIFYVMKAAREDGSLGAQEDARGAIEAVLEIAEATKPKRNPETAEEMDPFVQAVGHNLDALDAIMPGFRRRHLAKELRQIDKQYGHVPENERPFPDLIRWPGELVEIRKQMKQGAL